MEPTFDLDDPLGLNLPPPAAALAPDTVLGRGRNALFAGGLRGGVRSTSANEATAEGFTCQMALKHRLMLSEVKRIMKEFAAANRNSDGGLERKDFDKVMSRIFDVDAIDDTVSKNAYRSTGVQQKIDIEQFLDWYVQNMFTQVCSMNAEPTKRDSEALIYEVAKLHQVSPMVVDKVKVKFDYFDTDKSGQIDFNEFQDMFCSILRTNRAELNPERLKRFWQEIDGNGDGGVDFKEFSNWYLKYFNVDSDDPEDFDMAGPLRAFYDSYDPRVQRRNSISRLPTVN